MFFAWPASGSVTQGYGCTGYPIEPPKGSCAHFHDGIDIANSVGTPVRAAADGVVAFTGYRADGALVVVMGHAGGYETVYAHLSRISVKRGARVVQNDTIGAVGQTGWATGPHLHYEFRVGGQARNPFSIAMPAALPVPPQDLPTFRNQAAMLVERLDLLANVTVAQLQ